MLNKLLIGLIAFAVSSAILVPINRLIFRNDKKITPQQVSRVSLIIAGVISLGYWLQLFVLEGEGSGTGLDQGFSGLWGALPLFLFVFVIFNFIVFLPGSIVILSIYSAFKGNRKRK